MTGVTFAQLLEPAGLVIAAGIVTGLIEILKATIPGLAERVSGALMALVLTAVLYVLAGIAVGVPTLDAGLGIFMAWLACLTSSMGLKAGTAHAVKVVVEAEPEPKAVRKPPKP